VWVWDCGIGPEKTSWWSRSRIPAQLSLSSADPVFQRGFAAWRASMPRGMLAAGNGRQAAGQPQRRGEWTARAGPPPQGYGGPIRRRRHNHHWSGATTSGGPASKRSSSRLAFFPRCPRPIDDSTSGRAPWTRLLEAAIESIRCVKFRGKCRRGLEVRACPATRAWRGYRRRGGD
jgi:hypothetical protein